mmetsp:Transcript_33690/g.93038  ORF Transcript_33690/g.93038 Transcript_33690/m.93038 type:complete len:200 (-) Transcript_33690:1012-1611(-)
MQARLGSLRDRRLQRLFRSILDGLRQALLRGPLALCPNQSLPARSAVVCRKARRLRGVDRSLQVVDLGLVAGRRPGELLPGEVFPLLDSHHLPRLRDFALEEARFHCAGDGGLQVNHLEFGLGLCQGAPSPRFPLLLLPDVPRRLKVFGRYTDSASEFDGRLQGLWLARPHGVLELLPRQCFAPLVHQDGCSRRYLAGL